MENFPHAFERLPLLLLLSYLETGNALFEHTFIKEVDRLPSHSLKLI
jgi:hypothetical protein